MYTRCPKCSTCFRVTDRHLAIAKGKVRCGQCQHVFNAPEHAIDDLPGNKKTAVTGLQENPVTAPPPKPASKKPAREVKIAATIAATQKEPVDKAVIEPKADIKTEKKPAAVKKVQKTREEKEENPVAEAPVFKADATMIADISKLDSNDVNEVDLDTPSGVQDAITEHQDDDDLFDDSFDLNAAIDELTKSSEEEEKISIVPEETKITPPAKEKTTQDIPTKNSDDVFTTDAYEATKAGSVAEIFSDVEGQLSLDIPEPEEEKKYDANEEFEFIELDEAEEPARPDKNDSDEIDQLNLGSYSTDNDIEDVLESENVTPETSIDEDELFDQVDLSDLDDEHSEEILLEDTNKKPAENDIPFQLRDDIEQLQAPTRRRLHPLLSLFFILILTSLSFSQLAYFRAYELVNLLPSSHSLLEAFCEKFACHYSGPRDAKKIQLLSRDVRLHPKEKKALLISAAMVNKASFAQPYPDIHIRLSDISGNVVAERVFNAKTYMGKLSNPFLLMKPQTPVHINFEVVDPGKDAVNFEFTFL